MTTQDQDQRRRPVEKYAAAGGDHFETRPFLKIRKGYVEVLAAGRRKNIIHGLIELDVTELRRMLRVCEAVGQDFDGAAAARFARRVADLVESADGLSPPVRDVHAPPAP